MDDVGQTQLPQLGTVSANEADVHVAEPVQLEAVEAAPDLCQHGRHALVKVDPEEVSVGEAQLAEAAQTHRGVEAGAGEPVHDILLMPDYTIVPAPGGHQLEPGCPGHAPHRPPQLGVGVPVLALAGQSRDVQHQTLSTSCIIIIANKKMASRAE